MLISVIIPIYNVREYLDRCILSVVDQSYKDIEILLIDDGSTDGSEKLCNKWEQNDERIVTLRKENGGLGSARNYGIKYAKGDYLAFLDADDWWEKDALQLLVDAAERYCADLVYMNFYWESLQEDGSYKQRVFYQKTVFEGSSNAYEHSELVFSSDARTWSKFYRASLFKDNEILFPNHPFEDFPINPLVVLLSKRICQVHKALYHYDYKRNGNITGNSGSYAYFPIGLEELKQSLIKFGFWDVYKDKYEDYAINLCRGVINGKKIYAEDKNHLMKYLFDCYPDKMKRYKYKFCYIGSFAGEQILVKNTFHDNIIANAVIDIPDGAVEEFDYTAIDITRMDESDYILVDLIGLRTSVEKQMQRIIDIIQKSDQTKVCIIELYFAKRHGESLESVNDFDDADDIEKKNKILKEAYETLNKGIPGAMRIKFDNRYVYTYEHTNYGCLPCFFNSRFYEKAFNDLYDSLECEAIRNDG